MFVRQTHHKSSQRAVVLQFLPYGSYTVVLQAGECVNRFLRIASPAHTFGLHLIRLRLHQSPGVYTLPRSHFKL